jgi:hypothetical protein
MPIILKADIGKTNGTYQIQMDDVHGLIMGLTFTQDCWVWTPPFEEYYFMKLQAYSVPNNE